MENQDEMIDKALLIMEEEEAMSQMELEYINNPQFILGRL